MSHASHPRLDSSRVEPTLEKDKRETEAFVEYYRKKYGKWQRMQGPRISRDLRRPLPPSHQHADGEGGEGERRGFGDRTEAPSVPSLSHHPIHRVTMATLTIRPINQKTRRGAKEDPSSSAPVLKKEDSTTNSSSVFTYVHSLGPGRG